MNEKLVEFNRTLPKKQIDCPKTGDVVRVHKRIKEGNKERVQVFKGLVIAVKGKQSSSPMITVRRESDGIGTEIVFPLYLPTIEKIEVLRHSKVRQAKLYYMRGRSGKRAKMKIQELSAEEKKEKQKAEEKKSEEKEAAREEAEEKK